MKKKLASRAVVLIVFSLLVSSELITQPVYATTETRYMRSDSWSGLDRKLLTSQSASYISTLFNTYDGSQTIPQYLGIRVFNYNTSAEITSGTAVAIASRSTTGSNSNTWACPQTSMTNSSRIKVNVYADDFSPPTTLKETFITDLINGTQLDSATWTVYYYVTRTYSGGLTRYYFRFGTATYDSRITNFQYSTPSAGGTTTTLTIQQLASAYGQFSTIKKMYSVKEQLVSSYQQLLSLKTLRQTVQQLASAYQQLTSFHRVILIAQQLAEAINQMSTTKTLTALAQTVAETYQELHSIKSLYNTFQQLASVFQSIETKSRHEVILIVSQLAEAISQFATNKVIKPTFQQLAQVFQEFVTSLPAISNEGMAIIFVFLVFIVITSLLVISIMKKRRRGDEEHFRFA